MPKLASLILIVSLFGSAGCSNQNRATAERLMREHVKALDDLATAMETAKKASEVQAKHDAVMGLDAEAELRTKIDDLGITAAQKAAITQKLEPERKLAMERYRTAMMKLAQSDAEGVNALSMSMRNSVKKSPAP